MSDVPAPDRSADAADAGRPVFDPARLAAVAATGLLDTEAEEPFDRLTRLASTILDAPMAFMTVVDDERSFWKSRIGVPEEATQNTVEESFCQYVVDSGEGLVAGDAASHPLTKDNPSVDGMGVAAWAGFPVKDPDGFAIGSFCVVDTRVREFRADQIEALATLADAAGAEIALRLSLSELGEVTDTLRETLLPPSLPDVPHLELASVHVPADDGHGVLGDFYDAFEGNHDTWWVALGDVCGHGPPAAKTTALARWSVRANAVHAGTPQHVARRLNAQLLGRADDRAPHLTLALAQLRPGDDGSVTASVAVSGHPPARVLRADGQVEPVDAMGTALGWFEEVEVGTASVHLDAGDALVLYTDGLIESRVPRSRTGEEGLDEVLHGIAPGSSAQDVVDGLVDGLVPDGTVDDDVAILVVRARRTD